MQAYFKNKSLKGLYAINQIRINGNYQIKTATTVYALRKRINISEWQLLKKNNI